MKGEYKGELSDAIYSNLSEESPLDLDHYIKVCRERGITVSETIIKAIREDRKNNTVNKRTDYPALRIHP
jgi:hypothetical protein